MARPWINLVIAALLLLPGNAEAHTADLSGAWDTAAVVRVGPDSGETLWGSWDLTSGGEVVAGTFRATILGDSIAGSLSGTQAEGDLHCTGESADSGFYQMTVVLTLAPDQQSFTGSWTDSGGRSGDYRGVRRAATLPQAGEAPWELLIAAWSLLGAALLSRGARRHLASWDGDDAR